MKATAQDRGISTRISAFEVLRNSTLQIDIYLFYLLKELDGDKWSVACAQQCLCQVTKLTYCAEFCIVNLWCVNTMKRLLNCSNTEKLPITN